MNEIVKKDPVRVAKKQAANIMKRLQGTVLKSVGTVRNYEQALSIAAQYANKNLNCGLRDMTREQAVQYLIDRGSEVGQKTLDMDRQALQSMQHLVKTLPQNEKLTVIKSEQKQILKSRAYSPEQIKMISENQNDKNQLATEIAHKAGLRAHELITIAKPSDRPPSDRVPGDQFSQDATAAKFRGCDNSVIYTVEGKGGLVREVAIPQELANRLEAHRLETPATRTDRNINYKNCRYDIGGGRAFSASFSRCSKSALGHSSGAHGLRHSYAQERMGELQKTMPRNMALKTVSLEMGHFRPEITEVYLR